MTIAIKALEATIVTKVIKVPVVIKVRSCTIMAVATTIMTALIRMQVAVVTTLLLLVTMEIKATPDTRVVLVETLGLQLAMKVVPEAVRMVMQTIKTRVVLIAH